MCVPAPPGVFFTYRQKRCTKRVPSASSSEVSSIFSYSQTLRKKQARRETFHQSDAIAPAMLPPNPGPFGPKSAAKNSWLYGARPTEVAKPRGGFPFSVMTPSVATLATALVLTISSPFPAAQAGPLPARIAPPPVVRSQPSAAVAPSLKPEMYPSPALFGGVASVTAAAGLVYIRDAKAKAIKAAEEAAAKEVSEEAKTFFDRDTFFAEEAATKEARDDRKAFFVRSSFFAAEVAAAKVQEAAVQMAEEAKAFFDRTSFFDEQAQAKEVADEAAIFFKEEAEAAAAEAEANSELYSDVLLELGDGMPVPPMTPSSPPSTPLTTPTPKASRSAVAKAKRASTPSAKAKAKRKAAAKAKRAGVPRAEA